MERMVFEGVSVWTGVEQSGHRIFREEKGGPAFGERR